MFGQLKSSRVSKLKAPLLDSRMFGCLEQSPKEVCPEDGRPFYDD